MAVTVSTQVSPIGTKLVQDTDVSNTAVDNTTLTFGTLYMVEIDNTGASSTAVYFKMADSADATAGTTAANLVLMIAAGTKMSYVFPTGITFSTGFSHWCTKLAAESDTTVPADTVSARYVTS
jgi:hypothetical protein